MRQQGQPSRRSHFGLETRRARYELPGLWVLKCRHRVFGLVGLLRPSEWVGAAQRNRGFVLGRRVPGSGLGIWPFHVLGSENCHRRSTLLAGLPDAQLDHEYHNSKLGETTSLGQATATLMGFFTAPRAPFGYKIELAGLHQFQCSQIVGSCRVTVGDRTHNTVAKMVDFSYKTAVGHS